MHGITESLFVGNVDDANNPPAQITGLLFVAEEHDVAPPDGVLFSRVPLREFTEADPHVLRSAIEWLEQHAGSHRLLVCCRAGMGRSVSVIIAYLCCVLGKSYEDALLLLRSRRPGATPLPALETTIRKVQELRKGSAVNGSGSTPRRP